jgi:hypothetical protein
MLPHTIQHILDRDFVRSAQVEGFLIYCVGLSKSEAEEKLFNSCADYLWNHETIQAAKDGLSLMWSDPVLHNRSI